MQNVLGKYIYRFSFKKSVKKHIPVKVNKQTQYLVQDPSLIIICITASSSCIKGIMVAH